MRFWIREIAGWLLILLGLFILYVCLSEVVGRPNPHFLAAPFALMVGFIVFRGGIHLLKVAVAARVCLHAERQVARQAERQKRRVTGEAPAEVIAPEW
jgi:hypothetical protein